MSITQSKPLTAYVLAATGVALQLVAAIVLVYAVFFQSFSEEWWGHRMMGPWMMHDWGGHSFSYIWVSVWIGIMVAVIGLGAYGAILMNNADIDNIRTGATLVLVAAVVAFPTMWGFFIGSLLMFIGSLLGLTWQPRDS
ncbi:MAG: hypothetical protein ACE5KC_00645 [Candidatus Bathyarchaeia archaeon]